MRKVSSNINESILGNIKYRNNVVTGVIATDNGNNTYNVYISGADTAYPNIHTTARNPDFAVGDGVELLIEYGSKEMPIIIGYSNKVVQEFTEIEVNYAGGTTVVTLDAYNITSATAYLEGRVAITEMENCTKRGFYYGQTTAYGSDTYTTGSFAAGSYAIQTTGLSSNTTYYFCAYVYDADGDEQTGDNMTFTTLDAHYLFTCDYGSGMISKHDGISETILDTFHAPELGYPTGLCNDGTNLISCEDINATINIHSGMTSAVATSIPAPSANPSAIAYDGSNIIICDWFLANADPSVPNIFLMNGKTSGVTSSFCSPATGGNKFPRGLVVIGGNLISADANDDKIYVHSGITSGITSSFPAPLGQVYGLGNVSTDLLSANCGQYTTHDDTFYRHSGISSGITATYNLPATTDYMRVSGITYI